jgi:hypothetical protein
MEVEPMIDAPPEQPVASQRGALIRLAAGVALILAAVLVYGLSRLLASEQLHSYDPGASPPATVRLIAGKQYQLSSPIGVGGLQKRGLLDSLGCSWSSDGNQQNPLTVLSTMTDARDLRTFATVIAPSTGQLRISCTGIDKVFVDDSEDSSQDSGAVLVLLSVLIGVLGVPLAVSGWYRLPPLRHRLDEDGSERDPDLFDDQRV